MKYFSSFILIFLLVLSINKSYAEDALTIKQQIDRIMEEVKDLNKAVFNKSFDNNQSYSTDSNVNDSNDIERFTSIDIRIYDLEKDIKNLTLQFEEIFFKLDDISKDMISLESKLISKLDIINTQSNIKKIDQTDTDSIEDVSVKQENTLGTIVISEKDNSLNDTSLPNSEYDQEENKLKKELSTMTPEEQMQLALDQMMKKNYSRSKEILEQFISNFPENQLSGSAHFWLGKIYLFETNYRKAAIVFGEGVQKFPKSIKAAEMYYEMAKSLKEMNKIPEACKTLVLLEENYQDSKFTKDPEKITNNLDCAVNN